MAQTVWHRNEIGRVCETVLTVALSANDGQSTEYLRGVAVGVMAVAHAFGATVNVQQPQRQSVQVVEVVK